MSSSVAYGRRQNEEKWKYDVNHQKTVLITMISKSQ